MMKFFFAMALTALSLCAFAGESYNFYMISDTHLGAAETYCTDPAAPKKFRTKKNIHRADKVMPALKAMFEDMVKKSDENTRFLFEAGDLIEGGARDEKTHEEVLRDALSLLNSYFKYPIYMIKGNHEAYGMGGEEAYRAALLPEIAKTIGQDKLDCANYTVTVGEDLFIFLDGYCGSRKKPWEFAGKILDGLKEKPRYVFVAMHNPVIPSHWDQETIRAFRDRLLEYNAVLLCGHCHRNTVTVFEKNGKKLVQITVSSFLEPNKKGEIRPAENTKDTMVENYRKSLTARWKKEAFIPEFDREWAQYITDYRNFGGAGYARIDVSDSGITIDYQSRVLTQPPLTFRILGAAKADKDAKTEEGAKAEKKERMIYVVRHCQAAGKGEDIIRPVEGDAGITQLGVEQSKLLGKRLKELNFSGRIYASPYFRTVATACYAAAECGSKVYPDPRVQERVHAKGGNMKKGGATLEQLRALFPDQIAPDAELPFPWLYTDVEPKKSTAHRKRMARSLDAILAENPEGDIMIVSHAGAVGQLAAEMKERTHAKIPGGTWNCCLYKYAVDSEGKFRFVGYEIGFLPDDAVTSNMHKIDPKKKPGEQEVKSGVDYKYDL